MLLLVINSCSLNIPLKSASLGGELWDTAKCYGGWQAERTLS